MCDGQGGKDIGPQVEVTKEMISAGLREMRNYYSTDETIPAFDRDLVRDVFCAMYALKRRSSCANQQDHD